jgi:psp operon transcriptional activator
MEKTRPYFENNESTLDRPGRGEALGQSEAFLTFMERLSAVAAVDRPVLIIGERGTGKELAAARLHYLSRRWQGPLVPLNCAALTPSLIESELFGYEAGAFTGAARRRIGRFEVAHSGTLFLDEIATIPLEVQEKILRVVEYGGFERVGGTQTVQVDVRIVGATNVHLPSLVASGRFKQDLLDRLSFEVLFLPPLRSRQGDVAFLARHFAARMAFELGREIVPDFTASAQAVLEAYPWPGNVRELKNVVERAVYRAQGDRISEIVFDPFQAFLQEGEQEGGGAATAALPAQPQPAEFSLPEAVRDLEIRSLKKALERARYNQRAAAEILKISYHQFRGLYRKYRSELEAEADSGENKGQRRDIRE